MTALHNEEKTHEHDNNGHLRQSLLHRSMTVITDISVPADQFALGRLLDE
ncbi:hypothetical protein [Halocatena marina]|uniref:Uncharacterized protein n=1 Tax=Halocatena marina TaxID=2934937 RepID=A0ABD5YW11_9EURY|nr:hypothetical protein [Halocatena marina]